MGRSKVERARTQSFEADCAPFRSFGRSAFWPFRARLSALNIGNEDFANVRRAMRSTCPPRPGVYGMIDHRGELIYVGVSNALRKRLVTYFQGGETVRKERAIAAHVDRLVWEVVGHPLAAHLRELELIRRHQPRFNVQGRDRVRPLGHIYIGDESAPRLRTARRVPRSARYSWGPLRIRWQIREAIEIVNRLFKLCDCPARTPMHFADQRRLFPLDMRFECLRGEIGTCLGPCAGACTHDQYAAQIRAARVFLDGHDHEPIAQLEQQLAEAVAHQQFERAARLHDTLTRLRFLTERLVLLREPPLPHQFVYPIQLRRRNIWLLVKNGEVATATSAPIDSNAAATCLKQLRRTFSSRSRRIVERPETDRPAAAIVASWFRTHPEERERFLTPTEARRTAKRVA